MTQPPELRPSVAEGAVFLAELVLLAVLATAGAQLGDATAARILLGIALPLVVAVVWGRWLAPRAPARLAARPGLAAKLAIFTVAAVLLAVAGFAVAAAVFWLLTAPLLVLVERGRAGLAGGSVRGH